MIYELREYYAAPGKSQDLHKRFAEIVDPLFKKHGIRVVGYWNVVIGEMPKLVYITQFNDYTHREQAWNAFHSDPDWIAGQAETEKNGPLVSRAVVSVMTPTAYSALQ